MIEFIIKIFIRIMGIFCFHNHYKMSKEERVFFYENDLSGCFILTRINKCSSNLFIKGYYKHIGIIDKNDVIEAKTKDGVVSTPIEKFLEDKDAYCVLHIKNISDEIDYAIVKSARDKIGVEYDMLFEQEDDKFYCSEAAYDSAVEAVDGFVLNYDGSVIVPQDFYNKEKLSILREIRKR